MNPCNSLVIAVCTTLAFAAPATKAGEMAHVPHIAAAKAAAGAISRAERAIIGYVTACAADAAQDLNDVLTEDARIEFALDEPGKYLSIDAISLGADCAADSRPSASPPLSNLWIFPTLDANTVFAQYDVPAPSGTLQRQLVLVEMSGDRIARMLNFAASPSVSSAQNARARLTQ